MAAADWAIREGGKSQKGARGRLRRTFLGGRAESA